MSWGGGQRHFCSHEPTVKWTYTSEQHSHRAKINSTVSDLCENCNFTEETDHYLFQCKKYKKEREQLENRVEEILNGAGLNEVADINLAVLVGMVENAHRETQNELMRALMEFTYSLCYTHVTLVRMRSISCYVYCLVNLWDALMNSIRALINSF